MKKLTVILLVVFLTFGIFSLALADGTEILGTPSVNIASGTGIVAAGTGLVNQPGTINVTVPGSATVNQVLLYWEGQMGINVGGDDTIVVNGSEVTGTLIGGPTFFFTGAYSSAFRADITNLGMVTSGINTLTVTGLSFTKANNGAGVIVIFDDGSEEVKIDVRDGLDLAFINFPEPRKSTVPQAFTFVESPEERTADLALFFGSIAGTISGAGADRPTSIEVTTGGVTTVFSNLLASIDGEEWDTLNIPVTIPAGATSLTVQAFSRDDYVSGNLPASFSWIAAVLSVPSPPPPDGEGCTPGFWRNPKKFSLWPIDPDTLFSDVFGVGPADVLKDTIRLGGGGEKALIRHATAAYLNSLSPDVDYLYSPDEVIAIVQEAYATGNFEAAKDMLEAQNDPTYCPLS